ncbi:tetratricopeptide repeat protein [bacterium]|nr:tetratricopeptide repeat protein [bacterium]
MKRLTSITGIILLVCILFSILGLTGCGSSSKAVQGESQTESGEDIDALLGLTNYDDVPRGEPVETKTEETIGEDDVLRLLGVEQGAKEVEKTPATTIAQPVKQVDEMNNVSKAETQPPATSKTIEEVPAVRKSAANRNVPFQTLYGQAKSKYDSRNYRLAIQEFETLLVTNMNHSLSDNCQYWIGESYYGLGKFEQSVVAFEKVFTFARSNKDADAQLKIGLCYLKLNNKVRAREELQKLIDNYPTYNKVSYARRLMSQLDGGQ